MANEQVEDDDQWLYGDDKGSEEDKNDALSNESGTATEQTKLQENDKDKENEEGQEQMEEDKEDQDNEKASEDGEDKEKDSDGESSDEDNVTITIGELKKQTDIVQAAPHQARFHPKGPPTAGLKDEDFNSVGKINGIPVVDYNLDDLEEKPWRKPGTDISDFFNYGFNEETWFKYCERQKRMRIHESEAGLGNLGINMNKQFGIATGGSSNTIPVALVNDNSKYSAKRFQLGKAVESEKPSDSNRIQVMTADKRAYSSKTLQNQYHYDDMDFGGNPYDGYYQTYYQPPYRHSSAWANPPVSVPPPVWSDDHSRTPNYCNEDSAGPPSSQGEDEEKRSHRSRKSHHRSRSRSPSRHRHSRHSRSRSPSHRHKRKKSKRDRDSD